MDDDVKYVVGGAALGAIVGALAAWSYRHYLVRGALEEGTTATHTSSLSRRKALRLAWAVIGVVRQVLDLG